jgi:hypothetical protein
MKIVLKGILAREDARLAADYGMDGIIVSNHSGRVVDSGRATIEILPDIIEAVGDRMPVLVDSGVRRGTDIIKALAMGAQAVCIGRPYLWGLGAFGQPGVERVLKIGFRLGGLNRYGRLWTPLATVSFAVRGIGRATTRGELLHRNTREARTAGRSLWSRNSNRNWLCPPKPLPDVAQGAFVLLDFSTNGYSTVFELEPLWDTGQRSGRLLCPNT